MAGEPAEDGTDTELARMGERIRRWREQDGLTLQELARRSHVSVSTIHKVETLQMVPTVAVLMKIAHGLGRPAGDFLREETAPLEVVLLRAGQRHPLGIPERLLLERLTGDLFDNALEVWRATVQPGQASGRGRMRYDGEQLILCEQGEICVRIGDEEFVLRSGDSLHFKASRPHAWENRSAGETRLLIIGTVPQALRAALHSRLGGEK